MAAPHGVIRVHHDGLIVLFQVDGWMTMNQSLSFRRCAERCLEEGARKLWVDLRRCTFMDSTFIGTLLTLKRRAQQAGDAEFAVVTPSSQCTKLFQQMGLGDLFPIIAAHEAEGRQWSELTAGADDQRAFQRNVIHAHEELARLGGPAAEAFRAVVRCLQRELEGARNPGS